MGHSAARLAIAASALVAVGISAPAIGQAETGIYTRPKVELTVYYARNLGLLGPTATSFASFNGPGAAVPVPGYPAPERKAQAAATPASVGGRAGAIVVALAGVPRVSSSALASMRAGFALPNGVMISFGFTSSTFLNGGADPLQSFNILGSAQGTASGTTVQGTVITQNQGVDQTVPLTSSNLTTSLVATANSALTSVQTIIGSAGLSTIIKNQADDQLIQHFQTLNVNTTGLNAVLSQQVSQALLSRALSAATVLGRQ